MNCKTRRASMAQVRQLTAATPVINGAAMSAELYSHANVA